MFLHRNTPPSVVGRLCGSARYSSGGLRLCGPRRDHADLRATIQWRDCAVSGTCLKAAKTIGTITVVSAKRTAFVTTAGRGVWALILKVRVCTRGDNVLGSAGGDNCLYGIS